MGDEPLRQAAHVLLDVLSVFDDVTNPDPYPAVHLALRRLKDIEAVSIVYDQETDTRRVDLQPFLGAALSLLTSSIVNHMRDAPGLDGVTAIARTRTAMDRAHGCTYARRGEERPRYS